MSDETNILKKIWLSVTNTTTLFRVNTGKGWVGKGPPRRLADGSVILSYARPISLGFSTADTKPVVGASDLVGWTLIKITKDMIGKTIAVFTSIECKNSKGGKKEKGQQEWVDHIRKSGGIAGFAKSPEEAQEIIKNYTKEK